MTLNDLFYRNGFVIVENESPDSHKVFENAILESTQSTESSLMSLHQRFRSEDINPIRMSAFSNVNAINRWQDLYFQQAKSAIYQLIGPDLAIQNKLNLSIQMPGDHSSVLNIHTDTLSGQSPFELVVWVPFTKCSSTNSIFLTPKSASKQILESIRFYEDLGMSAIDQKLEQSKTFIDIDKDQVLLFSPTVFHGNQCNTTTSTRVSLNCRFKNIFSPESNNPERRMGTFYELLALSSLSRIGLEYTDPYWS